MGAGLGASLLASPAARADDEAERARRLPNTALQQILDGYEFYRRGDVRGAAQAWAPAAAVAPHRLQYLLAELLLNGMSGPPQTATAIAFLREPAAQGHAEGQYWLGRAYDIAGDNADALRWYGAAAQQRFTEAAAAAGVVHERFGDFAAARWAYEQAAAAGHARAQNNLGVLYADTRIPSVTGDEALKWFGEAARQGLADAQYNLGSLYERGGNGIPPDDVEAFVWLTRAAAQRHEGARQMLALVTARLTPQQRAAAEQRLGTR
ncbi:MAG: sel1 repeat family protein [Alphaproteobacteria bacterium]|nr:sel1 repeat family protein [Alphaproteobacteria bacterium]